MKSVALVLSYLSAPLRQRNTRVLMWLVVALVAMIVTFTVIFHFLMGSEGREHSWATGFYWTLTVMSTLGFGDITFTSDAGRIFSVVVLASGALFFLVLLPFTFIQFVFMPWMTRREASRAPRKLPEGTTGAHPAHQLEPHRRQPHPPSAGCQGALRAPCGRPRRGPTPA